MNKYRNRNSDMPFSLIVLAGDLDGYLAYAWSSVNHSRKTGSMPAAGIDPVSFSELAALPCYQREELMQSQIDSVIGI
ncbi:MAG: hypothetical protein ABW098_08595 [Candidatus Thiodiazotropha sp.]